MYIDQLSTIKSAFEKQDSDFQSSQMTTLTNRKLLLESEISKLNA